MKVFIGHFIENNKELYEDVVKAPFKWIAYILLKIRNSYKLLYIEQDKSNLFK